MIIPTWTSIGLAYLVCGVAYFFLIALPDPDYKDVVQKTIRMMIEKGATKGNRDFMVYGFFPFFIVIGWPISLYFDIVTLWRRERG